MEDRREREMESGGVPGWEPPTYYRDKIGLARTMIVMSSRAGFSYGVEHARRLSVAADREKIIAR